jgi:hypothetical protein
MAVLLFVTRLALRQRELQRTLDALQQRTAQQPVSASRGEHLSRAA